jgi:hypothetical protein
MAWNSCNAQNFQNCDFNFTLGRGEYVYLRNLNFPNKYPSGRSCRFVYRTVPYYAIRAECTVRLESAGQKFFVSRDGDYLLRYGEVFSSNNFVRESYGQRISFALTSLNDGRAGTFSCKLTSVQIKNCDCGWTSNVIGIRFNNRPFSDYNTLLISDKNLQW